MAKTITEKAKKILQIIAEHGYVTSKDIEMYLDSERQAFRIINTLSNDLKAIDFFATRLKPDKAYYLTKKGSDMLSSVNAFRVMNVFKPCDYGPTAFYHTLAIIHTRLALEKHPQFYDFETPRVLMARVGELPELKPDAELVFRENLTPESQLFRAGIEVELHPKWHKRNVKKIHKFDTSSFAHLKSILWVCSENTVADSMARAIKESKTSEPRRHRFVLYNDLVENGVMSCKVSDYSGRECGLFL